MNRTELREKSMRTRGWKEERKKGKEWDGTRKKEEEEEEVRKEAAKGGRG